MEAVLLFIISILPIVLISYYIYHKDREKEPTSLLIKLFLSGFLACIIVIIISMVSEPFFPILFTNDTNKLNLIELLLQAFIGVALLEEGSKWLMTYLISYNNKAFDDIYDMIVYSVFVSLGFAFFENVFYVFDGGLQVGIIRALLSVPGHACNGVFMGYFLAISKLTEINQNKILHNKYIIMSILIPVLLHGIYDYCLLTGHFIFFLIFLIFIVYLYNKSIKTINRLANITEKIPKKQYCSNCGKKLDENICKNCGEKNT